MQAMGASVQAVLLHFVLILVLAAVGTSAQIAEVSGMDTTSFQKPDILGSSTVIGGMAVMFGRPDWQIGFDTSAPTVSGCTQQVQRIAARYGVHTSKASLKITPYFFYTWALPEDKVEQEDKYYRHSVVRWLVRDGSYNQVEPTAADVSDYIRDFGTCVSTAIRLGFKHIFISPMVDGDYNQPECCVWRNAAEFDPTAVLPGKSAGSPSWSYQSLVLQPTLTAVKAALQAAPGRDVAISWSLGAEQGRSFTVFASKWEVLAKQVVATLRDEARKVWVGPNFDPNKLCGYYCDMYDDSTKVNATQWEDFRSLLRTSNEYGVSSYPNVWERYEPAKRTLDVSQSVRQIDTQLKQFAGVSVLSLRRTGGGKRFVLNELGFGGCKEYGCDGTNTPDIYDLSINAYNGQGSFETYATPPVVVDPFRHFWTKSFKLEWYRQQLLWFRRDIRSIRNYAPDAAYIWAVGSWDIGAIYHPGTKGNDPDGVGCDPVNSYCDPDVLTMVKNFNRAGAVPPSTFFTLPGLAYYKPKPAAVRARSVEPEAVALSVDPRSVPGWAQPALFARPRWG